MWLRVVEVHLPSSVTALRRSADYLQAWLTARVYTNDE